MKIIEIKQAASGMEVQLLTRAGMPESTFNGKQQPCPICSGTDRFWWIKKKNSFGCRGCDGGDWLHLLTQYQGGSFPDTIAWVKSELGLDEMNEDKKKELELRARLAKRKAEASAKLKDENMYWDTEIDHWSAELHNTMKARQRASREEDIEQMIRLNEVAEMRRLAEACTARISAIMTSSSFGKSMKVFKALPKAKSFSTDAGEYAKNLNLMNIFDYGRDIFGIICVREMLIERKPKEFMAQVLFALDSMEKPDTGKPEFTGRNKVEMPVEFKSMFLAGVSKVAEQESDKTRVRMEEMEAAA